MSEVYKKAGVDLEAGYESVNRIKKHIKRTKTKGVLSSLGGFGGIFDLSAYNYKKPVLVSGTDGVGTKILIAKELKKYDTIGIDCVAMCCNDTLAQGALPIFFLDYIATSKVDPEMIEQLVSGVSDGCCLANCSLIGGETAEMPDLYRDDDFDIAGFCVAVCEKDDLIDNSKVSVGDILIGLPSSGVHSNGFSLVRKIIKDNNLSYGDKFKNQTLGEVLLTPTTIYVNTVKNVLKYVNGISHITGGGFIENLPRVLSDGMGIEINENSFPILDIFKFLEEKGKIPHQEMFNIFNMGIGMVLVVSPNNVSNVLDNIENAYIIGRVVNGSGVKIL